jgi:hypothetical protein
MSGSTLEQAKKELSFVLHPLAQKLSIGAS